MKIVIVNLRYFISGGPERYMFNVKDVLESHGHEVIPFSIKHNLNEPSEYSSFFLDPIGKGEEVYFRDYKINNIKDVISLIGRLFYSFEAKRKLSALIKSSKPDLVYVLYYENKISPSIVDAAKKFNLPVVIRISDFGMICATNLFYLTKKQELCEKCIHKDRHHLIRNKCYHNSYFYSTLKYFSYLLHDVLGIYNKVDAYIIPSNFTISKYLEYGIPKSKINHIPTFFNFKNEIGEVHYGDFALFIGRIDPDKGIKTLVDSFVDTNYNLKIIGFSSSDYDNQIIEYLAGQKHNITFLGKMEFSEISTYLQDCCFTILPSECYDNFPNAILESFAYKKAVIATNIGSLKELVENEKTGLLFRHRDSVDLRSKVETLFADKDKSRKLGENGFQKLNNEFSKEKHYESLMNLFDSLVLNH
jgi:glycosyltransferase involved in cell wall biosynthesis